jgi:hypothetical protein
MVCQPGSTVRHLIGLAGFRRFSVPKKVFADHETINGNNTSLDLTVNSISTAQAISWEPSRAYPLVEKILRILGNKLADFADGGLKEIGEHEISASVKQRL